MVADQEVRGSSPLEDACILTTYLSKENRRCLNAKHLGRGTSRLSARHILARLPHETVSEGAQATIMVVRVTTTATESNPANGAAKRLAGS